MDHRPEPLEFGEVALAPDELDSRSYGQLRWKLDPQRARLRGAGPHGRRM